MKRKKKLLLNTFTAILNQIFALIFGLIVPRMIISNYGSDINGLVSSITQFLAFFSLMEMGVGGVVRAGLYKPLSESDHDGLSAVLISAKSFFSKIGMMMIGYTIILMIVYPTMIDNQLGYISTAILVLAIAISYISQYLFGIVNQLLLTSDQKSYIQLSASCFAVGLNTVVSILMIKINASIEIMKLTSAMILLLRPLFLKIYVSRNYEINYKIHLTEEPLKQKWNALTQSISYYIAKHADTLILTLFSTLENVSIYYVYTLVTHSLQQFIELITTGVGALLGDMYVRQEKKLIPVFSAFETLMHFMVTTVFTIAGITIIPFVSVYMKGVEDANYIVPIFAVLIVLASAIYAIRLPYNTMVQSAGHFKQTQWSAVLEAVLNVVISIILVRRYGLVGVTIGTVIAMGYRTIYLAWYLRNNILRRTFIHFVIHCLVDVIVVVFAVIVTRWIEIDKLTFLSWAIMAFKVSIIVFAISILINMIFYKRDFIYSWNNLLRRK